MIKVIKRNALDALPTEPVEHSESSRASTEATVNEWIQERRQNQIDSDTSSRETIARWNSTTDI